jgi:hypothetical protein
MTEPLQKTANIKLLKQMGDNWRAQNNMQCSRCLVQPFAFK